MEFQSERDPLDLSFNNFISNRSPCKFDDESDQSHAHISGEIGVINAEPLNEQIDKHPADLQSNNARSSAASDKVRENCVICLHILKKWEDTNGILKTRSQKLKWKITTHCIQQPYGCQVVVKLFQGELLMPLHEFYMNIFHRLYDTHTHKLRSFLKNVKCHIDFIICN